MPSSFIPLAEEIGLINTIGSWVLNSACSQLCARLDQGFAVVPLAVNLSARQFQQPGLADTIGVALRSMPLDALRIDKSFTPGWSWTSGTGPSTGP